MQLWCLWQEIWQPSWICNTVTFHNIFNDLSNAAFPSLFTTISLFSRSVGPTTEQFRKLDSPLVEFIHQTRGTTKHIWAYFYYHKSWLQKKNAIKFLNFNIHLLNDTVYNSGLPLTYSVLLIIPMSIMRSHFWKSNTDSVIQCLRSDKHKDKHRTNPYSANYQFHSTHVAAPE